ncbi:ROK family protein [Gryllotalpicola reticulitermitis]|uniref:ROK family protein n=1 Tax=Gryllotalpicola reticulitermitis TaxID=1184153 RepID=A0ABV8Q3C2_9MICO
MAQLKGRSSAETRSAVLDLIRSSGTVSRSELAVLSGLTEATISKIVKALLDAQLVVEAGFADSTGGKRPILLSLNISARYAIGVLLDARTIVYVIADMSGTAVHHMTAEGYGKTPPPLVIKRIASDIQKLMRRAKLAPSDVLGIGVAAAGRLDADGGVLRRSRVAEDWEDFAIDAALHDATGMRVLLENDANSAALGEFWSSRMPATQDFAVLYMANGIGCGIVIDGALYRGASGNVGELGHMTVDINGPVCFCGRRGCLEPLAAPLAVVRRARADPELIRDIGVRETLDDETNVREDFAAIARGAVAGDERCRTLILDSARALAAALVSMVNLLDLDAVYLGGPGFADAAELYLDVLREALGHAFAREVHPVETRLSAVGIEAAALGAASVVLHRQLTPFRARKSSRPAGARVAVISQPSAI